MKFRASKWSSFEDEWVSYHDSEIYQQYKAKKTKEKGAKETGDVETELYSQLDKSYGKTMDTIKYFTKTALGKLSKDKKWKMEVWLDEKNLKNQNLISCGVALTRPKKSTIYVKKMAKNLNEALKQSLTVIERSIKREGYKKQRRQALSL